MFEAVFLGSCSNIPKTTHNSTSKGMQVAFITAGCTHTTFTKVLDILGMNPVSKKAFMKTIKEMHPIVENMVNEMCEREKKRRKALTSADGTWLTRGHHSKNATFSIRNYLRGIVVLQAPLSEGKRSHHQGGALQGDIQVGGRVRCIGTVSKSKRRGPANCRTLAGCRMPTPLQVAVPSSFFPEQRS